MSKFMVLFLIPRAVMADWQAKDAETRRPAEEKMMTEWNAWMGAHGAALTGMEVGGRTKSVSSSGVSDVKNDITLYCFVEAESHEAAAAMFEKHPHLQIPQSSIEVMEVRPMTGM